LLKGAFLLPFGIAPSSRNIGSGCGLSPSNPASVSSAMNPSFAIEPRRFRLGIDDDANASHVHGHLVRERKHRAQQRLRDSLTLCPLIDGQSGEAKNGDG